MKPRSAAIIATIVLICLLLVLIGLAGQNIWGIQLSGVKVIWMGIVSIVGWVVLLILLDP